MATPVDGLKQDISKMADLSMGIKVKMQVQKQIENLFQQSIKDMDSYIKKGDIVNSDKKLDLALQYSDDMKKLSCEIGDMLRGKTVR